MRRAASVQRRLLPDLSPPVGGFQLASLYWPCETLGGDIYDLVCRRDGAILLVADVMGHGPEAALISMLVKGAFQAAVATTWDPARLLDDMHRRLRRMLPDPLFVAAAVARLRPQRLSIDLANAGLPHPFVLRTPAPRVEELPLNGLPLGLLEARRCAEHDECSIRLEPRDVLLLASDGLGAITRGQGERFEDKRMRDALRRLAGRDGRAVLEGLAADATDFGNGRCLQDDVNLVAVTCTGAPEQAVSPARRSIDLGRGERKEWCGRER